MSETIKRRLRCAVYTRKSTDEGLEQKYNSIGYPAGRRPSVYRKPKGRGGSRSPTTTTSGLLRRPYGRHPARTSAAVVRSSGSRPGRSSSLHLMRPGERSWRTTRRPGSTASLATPKGRLHPGGPLGTEARGSPSGPIAGMPTGTFCFSPRSP